MIDSFRTNTPIQSFNYLESQYKSHLQPDSPTTQMRRFSNFTNPRKTAQNRLSSTSATIYNYSSNNNETTAYTNSYYASSIGSEKNQIANKQLADEQSAVPTKMREKM